MSDIPIRILVVEDDPGLLRQITEILSAHKYTIRTATSYNEAILCIENEPFDLAILDIMLDDAGSGINVLKYLREQRGYGLPVIMQTAMADDFHCVRCLNLGADDFIAKPVRSAPLIARIEAALRRAGIAIPHNTRLQLRNGAYADYIRRKIFLSTGEDINLSVKETQLLRYLAGLNGKPASAESIFLNVWNCTPNGHNLHKIHTLISRFRTKLTGLADIKSSYGSGYQIKI